MFLYRLNRAAKRASIAYEKPTADREAHIRRFIKALGNSRLKTTLQGHRFDTLSELEETLKRIEALQQDENRDNPDHQQKRRSTQHLQFGRFKPPQRRAEARAFVADGFSSSPSQGRYVHFEDEQNPDKEYKSGIPQMQSEGSGITNTSPTTTGSTKFFAYPSRLDAVTEEVIFRVGNIGGDVECLLGMDFMIAAGVRLCVREGVVRLPDEESLLMVGGPDIEHIGLEIPVRIPEATYLQPGRSVVVPVKYAQVDPEKVDEWAGHGHQWVSQFLYGTGRKPKAVKVVNISDQVARFPDNTVVACLVEKRHLPVVEGFARPRSQKYREWEKLVYEAEPSPEFLRREEEVARLEELNGPPAVERPNYQWPKKLLLRKKSSVQEPTQPSETGISLGEASAYMVFTNPRSEKRVETHREIQEPKPFVMAPLSTGDNLSANDEPRFPEISEDRNESQSEREPTQSVPDNESSEPEVVSRSVIGGDEPTRIAQKELGRGFPNSPVHLSPEPMPQLQEELARRMRLEVTFSGDAEASQLSSPEPNSDPK
ncbi:hypothetical protein PR003_g26075, partial [Phytophthora rubi]